MGLFGGIARLAGKVIKSGLSVATGGKSDAVLKMAKGLIGKGKPKAKPAMTLADAADVLKIEPSVTLSRTTGSSAVPGLPASGANGAPPKRRRRRRRLSMPKAPSTRKPPTGGLDLKAISAKWHAAGKPGKWLDFVKANRR